MTVASAVVVTSDESFQFTIDVSGDSNTLTADTSALSKVFGAPLTPDLGSLSQSLSKVGWIETASLDSTPPFGESWAASYVNASGNGIHTVVYASNGKSSLSTDLASLIFPYTVVPREGRDLIYRSGGAGFPPTAWFATEAGYLVLISADVKDPKEFLPYLQLFGLEAVDKLLSRMTPGG